MTTNLSKALELTSNLFDDKYAIEACGKSYDWCYYKACEKDKQNGPICTDWCTSDPLITTNKNNIFDNICDTWCSNNPDVCRTHKAKSCNNNFDPTYCKDFCVQNPGSCDVGVNSYCLKNPSDAICSCINSDVKKFQFNPVCTDNNCIRSGYATSSMMNSKQGGCQIVSCTTQVDISKVGGNVSLNNAVMEQNCGQKNPLSTAPSIQVNSATQRSSLLNTLIVNKTIIFILICCIAVGWYIFNE